MASPEVVVVIGDLHAGSSVALCTPEHPVVDDGVWKANRAQLWMYERWIEATTQWLPGVIGGRPFAVVVNGDCIEGLHHQTKQVISNATSDHVSLAINLLGPVTEDADALFMVRGTSAHVGHDSESAIGMALGAERQEGSRDYAYHNWRFEVCGKVIDAAHHMPTSARPWTESTGLGGAMQAAVLESVRAKEAVADIYLRAHRHKYGAYTDGDRLIVAGHSWQAKTDFAEKVVPHARVVVGLYVLDFKYADDCGLPLPIPWSRRPAPVAPVVVNKEVA